MEFHLWHIRVIVIVNPIVWIYSRKGVRKMIVCDKGKVLRVGKLMDLATLPEPARRVSVLVCDGEWLRIHHVSIGK